MHRSSYLLGKGAWALFTILFVIVLNFFLFRILPGDPARAGVRDPRLTVEAQQAIRERFGLDKPVINCFQSLNPPELGDCAVNPLDTQFFIYAGNLVRGEFGISYHTNRPVVEMITERLWNTLILIGAGQILAIIFGMALGILAAFYRKLDPWIMRTVDILLAFPAILIGLAVAAVFGAGLTAVLIALVIETIPGTCRAAPRSA